MSSQTTFVFPPQKKEPKITKFHVPWGEIMSDPTETSEKTVQIPSWVVGAAKVSLPAIVVAVGLYFRVTALEKELEDFKSMNKAMPTEIYEIRSKLNMDTADIRNKLSINDLKLDTTNKDVARSLERIENDLKSMRSEIKDLSNKKP